MFLLSEDNSKTEQQSVTERSQNADMRKVSELVQGAFAYEP